MKYTKGNGKRCQCHIKKDTRCTNKADYKVKLVFTTANWCRSCTEKAIKEKDSCISWLYCNPIF